MKLLHCVRDRGRRDPVQILVDAALHKVVLAPACAAGWPWVGTPKLLACALAAAPTGLCDLRDEHSFVRDSAVETLPYHDPDFARDHVEPAGVLRREVEFDPVENPARFLESEGFVERGRGVGRSSTRSRMHSAKSTQVRWSVTIACRHGLFTSTNMKMLAESK